ncbi:Detected protein of unknown function [Hibiscus syriacus]|uniref:DUF4378 domain-containing protein n=1 Tax=Hibiscus syriacus TaxID=106335 RepID=A0A6A2X0A4_HIBSY|nr:Detected protein of unknown function [Hibiscus syriacus]
MSRPRPLNAVAKLMGLEPMPYSYSPDDEDNNPLLQPLRSNVDPNRPTPNSYSARGSLKDPTSPLWKNAGMIMKPISSSRFLIEPAPWRHADATRGSQRPTPKHVKFLSKTPNSSTSIHTEIEKRLKDVELKQPRRDLGPLQQILEQLQAKGLLKTEHLVQKLGRLNSTHDEVSIDYIASLCENTNPDHRYICEKLLASGLLLRDLSSDATTFHLRPSSHPINPKLFFVLEQTKASCLLSEEDSNSREVSLSKPDHIHRKLIFDSVNEILVGKFSLVGASVETWMNSGKLARKTFDAQKLLKELYTEIEQFQAKKLNINTEEEEDDLESVLQEDVLCQSESWMGFNGWFYRMVLNVERMVFKDLVSEIVIGEGGILQSNQQRRRRLRRSSVVTSSTVLI